MTGKQLEELVNLYYEDILRYFVYRIRNRVNAEDLTQDTFYRFIRYAAEGNRFSGQRQCRAYLYKIASNVCCDYYSRRVETEELTDNIPSPGYMEEEKDLAFVLEEALSHLPDLVREAAVLYYFDGFRVREIAEIQGATISAVKSRLKTARDTLRNLLKEEGQ